MKNIPMAKRIIATKEKSAGNDTVGTMWIETRSFDALTPVKDIMIWGSDADGKLILTFDETFSTEEG